MYRKPAARSRAIPEVPSVECSAFAPVSSMPTSGSERDDEIEQAGKLQLKHAGSASHVEELSSAV